MRSPSSAFDLRAALTEELRAAIEELGGGAEDVKALHRCRVRIKRARALARVGRVGAPGLSAVFNDTARGVMRTLGPARDISALAQTARRLRKRAGPKTAAALKAVAVNLEAEHAATPLNVEAAHAGLKDLLALAQVWPEASARQIKRGAKRIGLRAQRACAAAREDATPGARHEWRKREKDRLYAADLLDRAWPLPRRAKRNAELADILGRERDVLLLQERIEAAPGLAGDTRAAERVVKLLRKQSVRLARRADKLGARLHAGGA